MYFVALATDYDGTLAEDGVVADATLAALKRIKESGRRLILVTGRELPDLKRVFPHIDLFDLVVAENGALLYHPDTEREEVLAPEPSAAFVERLIHRGVGPISVGRSIVATWEPHQAAVLETIAELGLELEIIFNKGAVMVLPSGVNKATGLNAALAGMDLSAHNVVGIGDAENDHAFMRSCGFSAAVANALPAVKDTADLVTDGARGAGVEELITALLEDDLLSIPGSKEQIAVGKAEDGSIVGITPREVVLITGSSGIGKSTLATALTERMFESRFQFCVFDPEGDYQDLEDAFPVGAVSAPPDREQALALLASPANNVVLNTLNLELKERPAFFAAFQSDLSALRARTAHPHWLVIDEAHHLLPAAHDGASLALPQQASGTIMITVHPEAISRDALLMVDVVVALGPDAGKVIEKYCEGINIAAPDAMPSPQEDQVLFWRRASGDKVQVIAVEKPRQSKKRHTRKYAEGHLDEERSFYFRGPESAMNLRAQNLMVFVQIAEGIDDGTWDHHLRAGDYSKWFAGRIGDDELADEASRIETDNALSSSESKAGIIDAVRRRYTAPASEREEP